MGAGWLRPLLWRRSAAGQMCSSLSVSYLLVTATSVDAKFDATASNILPDAERLTAPYPNATPVLVDMSDPVAVERLVAEADVVIRHVQLHSRVL